MRDLLERDGVLRDLDRHLERSEHGTGGLVLLHGEAGIGKTAVVRRFAERTGSRARVLIGTCEPLSAPRPLGPLVDVAPDLGEASQDALLSASADPRELFDRLSTDLRREPAVLILEDVHWADEATLGLLRHLARHIPATPVLVVATYRDDELGRAHPLTVLLGDLRACQGVHRYALDPLSAAAVARLAAELPVDVAELYRITGGNPFFVTEALATGTRQVPATVRDAVLGRVARLVEPARHLVEAAAVMCSPTRPDVLDRVVPGSADALDQALAAGTLHRDGPVVGFRHELARMAVLEAVPELRRAYLHGRVLDVLRAGPVAPQDLARLAFHAEQAHDTTAVLEFAPRAAAHAAALGAHREAAAHYGLALRHAGALPAQQRLVLLVGRSVECYFAGPMDEAIAARRAAIGLRRGLGDEPGEAEEMGWLSHLLWATGQATQALHEAESARWLLEGLGPSPRLAMAYMQLAQLAAYGRQPARAEGYARQAIAMAERFDQPSTAFEARVHAAAARAILAGDAWEELEELRRRTAEAGLAEPAARTAIVIAALGTWCGELSRALDAADWALSHCRDHDLMTFETAAQSYRADALVHRGRWSEAAAAAEQVLARPGLPWAVRGWALLALSLVRVRRGEPTGLPLLEEAFVGVDSAAVALSAFWAARAEAAWLAGDDVQARADAGQGLALVVEAGPWFAGLSARWLHRAGGTPPAHIRLGEPYALEIAGDWAGAAALWDHLGHPYDAALARLCGDVPAVRAALEAFESLGAAPAADRARTRLAELGAVRNIGPRPAAVPDPMG